MRLLTYTALLIAPAVYAQTAARYTITTVAGNGASGYGGDAGAASGAQLSIPYGLAITPGGALLIGDQGNSRIRQVAADGTISTIAGTGSRGYSGDGAAASNAVLSSAGGVAVDSSGTVYFADSGNQVIRKFAPGGNISTVAGNNAAGAGFAGDGGAATSAQLNTPIGIAVDSGGNLYIADKVNNRVRKVSPGGTITAFAGSGSAGFSGDGRPAASASLRSPSGVAVDGNGNVYIADTGNSRIRKVTSDGIILTIAGTGVAGYSGDLGSAIAANLKDPAGVAVDSKGYVYIADTSNSRIRRVSPDGIIVTVAGTGRFAYNGDGGDATSASLSFPGSVTVNAAGSVYVSDTQNHAVRLLTPNPDSAQLPVITGVVSAGAFGGSSTIAPGAWIEIYGSALAVTARGWSASDFKGASAPQVLDGTSITIGGQPAVISYVSGGQVNALVPAGLGSGEQAATLTTIVGRSSPYPIRIDSMQPSLYAPSLFTLQGKSYAGAAFADGSGYALPAGAVACVKSRPAKPGETILMYGIGFGPVFPDVPYGEIAQKNNAITGSLQVLFGSIPALLSYAGLAPTAVGLYQFNVTVPAGISGDAAPLSFWFNGVKLNQTLYIAVQE